LKQRDEIFTFFLELSLILFYSINECPGEMLNYLLTTHGDFTLAAVPSPDAITLKTVDT